MCKSIKNLFSSKFTSEEVKEEVKEEWVWVEGYKGMSKDMQCYSNFQYELGKQYDMEEGSTVETCCGGYHLCLSLPDVFKYYNVGGGNRFFQVLALVRKSENDVYGEYVYKKDNSGFIIGADMIDKLAAKSIKIVRELTADEILKSYGGNEWNEKYKQLALSVNVNTAISTMRTDELVTYAYSLPFAQWLNENHKYEIAKAVGSQTDLSMDMKVLMIMNG